MQFQDIFNTGASGVSVNWAEYPIPTPGELRVPSFYTRSSDGTSIVQQIVLPTMTAFPDVANQIVLFNFSAHATAELLTSFYMPSPDFTTDGNFSPRRLLLASNYQKRWRHSFFAQFWVYDVQEKTLALLDPTSNATVDMNPAWSPNGQYVVCTSSF